MSWLTDLASTIGNVFVSDSNVGQYFPDLPSFGSSSPTGIGPIASGPDYASMLKGGSSGNSNSLLWPSIIGAGTQLAGTYFDQSSKKGLAEDYAKQQALANEQALTISREEMANRLEAARISAAAYAGSARKSALANLYSNWANVTQRGGEALGQESLEAGKNMTAGLVARASVLK